MFKDLPLPNHALARPAHEAARCAGALGQFWAYHQKGDDLSRNTANHDVLRLGARFGL